MLYYYFKPLHTIMPQLIVLCLRFRFAESLQLISQCPTHELHTILPIAKVNIRMT